IPEQVGLSVIQNKGYRGFMLISLLGYMGIGLIWGWWIGSLSGKITRPLFDGIAAGAATLMFALWAFYLSGMWAPVLFFCAGGLTLYLHLAWRRELIDRFSLPDSEWERRQYHVR
ncbi:MAG TPA: hypothetical protein PLY74_08955, partial [Methanothrix soehngenii]|nr:hypothetical protein [Methanothrix soehngenii]